MWNEILEHAITGKVIETLLDQGFRIEISDQDGGGLYIYCSPDNKEFEQGKERKYWIRLVPGNGVDLVNDYSTNLKKPMKLVEQFIKRFE